MSDIVVFQIALELWAAIFCGICGLGVFWTISRKRNSEIHLVHTILSVAILLICDVAAYMYRGDVSTLGWYVVRISNFMCFWLNYISMYYLFCYVSGVAIERGGCVPRWTYGCYKGVCAVYTVFLMVEQVTHWFYYFDETNTYHRSEYFWTSNILGVVLLAVYLYVLWINRCHMKKREWIAFGSYLIFPVLGLIVQLFIYGFSLLNLSLAVSVGLIYLEHLHYNAECLKDAVRQLETSNKVKDKFLQGISHEIRTPLHAILSFNTMISEEENLQEIRQHSANVESASKHLLSMVNNILDYCDLQTQNILLEDKEYSVEALFNDLIPYAKEEAKKKKLEFEFYISPEIPSALYGDFARISQVIFNLLSNANKYTMEGKVTVSFAWLQVSDDLGKIQLTVQDTGIGIKEEHLKQLCKCFERFDLEHTQHIAGLGLGLTITAHLLERMGGEFYAESEYQEGTKITIVIPQRVANAKPLGKWTERRMDEPKPAIEKVMIPEGLRVLAVDDSKLNLVIISKLLKSFQAKVDNAENGVEAVERVKNATEPYQLILMDQMMPIMDGTEAMKQIRREELAPNTKIVVFTADTTVDARERYLAEGFDEYISKPISPMVLTQLFQKWFTSQEEAQAYKENSDV